MGDDARDVVLRADGEYHQPGEENRREGEHDEREALFGDDVHEVAGDERGVHDRGDERERDARGGGEGGCWCRASVGFAS